MNERASIASAETNLRVLIQQFVPDGYADEDGVWQPGRHREFAYQCVDVLVAAIDRGGRVSDFLEGVDLTDADAVIAAALAEGSAANPSAAAAGSDSPAAPSADAEDDEALDWADVDNPGEVGQLEDGDEAFDG